MDRLKLNGITTLQTIDVERHDNQVEITVSEMWTDKDDNTHITEANIYLTKEKARKMRDYLTKFLNT